MDRTRRDILEHGWSAIAVDDHDQGPPFVYTIGLMQSFQHPELILFGLPVGTAHSVLSVVVDDIRSGKGFRSGEHTGVLTSGPVGIRPVDPSWHEVYLGYAMGYVREERLGEIQCVQVVWPDAACRLPGEPECDPDVVAAQPALHGIAD